MALDDSATVSQGNSVIIPVLENDYDENGDSLKVQSVRRARGVVHILEDSTLLYRPTPNFIGEDAFEYTITDGKKGKASAWVRVQVRAAQANLDPVAYDAAFNTQEEVAFSDTLPAFDADGDDLTYSIVDQGTKGSAVITDATTNEFTYTPDPDANGQDSFTFRVYDGAAYSNEAIVTINIEPVNDAPVITSPVTATATEDELFTYTATASDVDDATVTITFSNLPGWLTTDGSTVSGIPGEGTSSATFTITADDGKLTAVLDVTVTIGQVNDTPVADDMSVTTDEDTAVDIVLSGTDPEGTTLSYNITADPTSGSLSGEAPNLTYTPEENYNGDDAFTYTVDDGINTSAEATVTITIEPVNDAPVAVADTFSVPEDSPVRTLDVLANDIDVDGDDLIITNFRKANGILHIINGGKHLSYEPTPNFSGEDVFYYTIIDTTGLEDEGTVTVVVSGVNDAPVAYDAAFDTQEEVAFSDTLPAFDADGDDLTYSIVYQGTKGSAVITDATTNEFTYTPDPDANGQDSFTFRVYDGAAYSNEATVTVTIDPVNDAPVFTSSPVTAAAEGSAYTYNITVSDVDEGAMLTIGATTLPAWLTLNDGGDGTAVLTGTPDNDDVGDHPVVLTLTDGVIATPVTQSFTITVSNVNDAPVAVNDEAFTDENTPVSIAVLENDTDEDDGDVLSVASVTDPAHGSVLNNEDSTVTYTPEMGFSGSDNFDYTVSDGNGGEASATVTVYVNVDEGVVSYSVGTEGGTIETEIGASIDIPAGALDGPIEIVISLFDEAPPGAVVAGPAYFFGPSGTQFNLPVTITVLYDPLLLPPGLDIFRINLLRYNENDGSWDVLPSEVDTVAHTITGQTDHFSGFAAGYAPNNGPQASQALPDTVIAEDTPYATVVQAIPDYFTDLDVEDQLVFSATALDEGLDTLIISQELDLIAIPGENFFGDVHIAVFATDDWGAAAGDTLLLTVTPVNDAPTFLVNLAETYTIGEDSLLQIALSAEDVENDDITFNAVSDTSAVATVVQDTMLWVIPTPDWFGTAHIMVSATDGQDTTHLAPVTLTVGAVNDAPSAFALLEPANAAVIQVQPSDLGDSLTFAWAETVDPDGDPVRYTFMLTDSVAFYFEYGDTTVNEVRVPYADILAAIRDQELTSATFWWTIIAISGQDITEADNGPYNLTIDISTLAVADQSQLPQLFALHQNYPNPFNPVTTLRYELPAHCRALLVIYDMRGREVIRLVDGYVSAGYNKVVWNSSDASGRPVPSGIYFARLITSEYTHIIKMSLIR